MAGGSNPASPTVGGPSTEESWELLDILAILRARWRIISAILVLAVIAGGIITFRAPKLYPAKATLIIQSDTSRMISAQDPLGAGSMYADQFFQTQYRRIVSQSVLQRAIEAVKMTEWPEFQEEPNLCATLVEEIQLKPIRGSRMVEVLYEGPVPENSARLVNALIDSFETEFRETRRKEAQTGLSSLGGSLAEIEEAVSAREEVLRQYMKDNNVITTDPNFTVPYVQLQEISRSETTLLQQVFVLDAQVTQMQKAGEDLQSLLGMEGVADQQRLLIFDQSLNALLVERDSRLRTFGPSSPEITSMDRQIESVRQNQRLVAQQLTASVMARREGLKLALAETRKKKAELEVEVQAINQRFIEVERLRSNLRQAQDRYQEVMADQARGQIFGQMDVNPILVVERPTVALIPSKPRKALNMAMALMLGLVFGVGLAFTLEMLDDSVRSTEDLEKLSGLHALGVVPEMREVRDDEGRMQLVLKHPHALASEAIRRTCALLDISYPPEAQRARVFLVSSAQAGEGKTTLAANLALAMAQNNRRVLWVDADMRHPTNVALMGLPVESAGLAEYLAGQAALESLIQRGRLPTLDLLPSGHATRNAGELITHARLKEFVEWARARYAVIVLDTPPVLLVSDALVLSPLADIGVVVISGAKTRRSLVRHAAQALRQGGLQLAGAMLNDPKGRLRRVASGYGYGYGYGYGGRDHRTNKRAAVAQPESSDV